ncbi:hypothetical protein Kisp02_09760 [Kineosporia sp. NBRC 101731]|nr:hypothetical protein Kisp02_09760 [Kineosporia sp. NBRC 101731]
MASETGAAAESGTTAETDALPSTPHPPRVTRHVAVPVAEPPSHRFARPPSREVAEQTGPPGRQVSEREVPIAPVILIDPTRPHLTEVTGGTGAQRRPQAKMLVPPARRDEGTSGRAAQR